MKPVAATAEIILWKYLNKSVDEQWSTWALDTMLAGCETDHLVELAGIYKPFNQFELASLTDKVFRELQLDLSDENRIVTDYTVFVLKEVLGGRRDLLKTLRDLKDVCIALDYPTLIYDFYSLYFAKEDLNDAEVQWYWQGADRTNIDAICLAYFQEWLTENDRHG